MIRIRTSNLLPLAAILCAFSLGVPGTGAQNHADFNGIYDLNQGNGRVEIKQSATEVSIFRLLEGRENNNTIRLDGKMGACITPSYQTSTCRAQWAGDALTIHFYTRENGNPRQPPIQVHTLERLSLSKNQQILTIRIEVDAPLNPNSTGAPQPLQVETYTRE